MTYSKESSQCVDGKLEMERSGQGREEGEEGQGESNIKRWGKRRTGTGGDRSFKGSIPAMHLHVD